MTNIMRRHPSAILLLTLVALLGLAQTRCGTRSKARPDAVEGYVTVVKKATNASRGDLTLISIGDGSSRTLGTSVSDNDYPSYSSTTNSVFTARYLGDSPEIASYSIGDTAEQFAANGHRPTAQGDSLAFCDSQGLVVMDLRTRVTSVVVAGHYTGCVPLAWSPDGQLAFVETSPLDCRDPCATAVYIWDAIRPLREIPLSEAQFGASAVSWSSDGARIAISADHEQIVVKESSTGATAFILPGTLAKYAPDSSKLAVLKYNVSDTMIGVYDGKNLMASRSLGPVGSPTFDWISGSDTLALTLNDSLATWGIHDGNLREVYATGSPLLHLYKVRSVPARFGKDAFATITQR